MKFFLSMAWLEFPMTQESVLYVDRARLDGGAGCHRLCNNQILRGTDVGAVVLEVMERERERKKQDAIRRLSSRSHDKCN
jgi:hypothetical protein